MGTNNAGAAAGLITTTARRPGTTSKPRAELGPPPPHARYARARAEGTTITGWRELARAYDWSADNADTLVQRQHLRERADECRAVAERIRLANVRQAARQVVAA